MRIAGKIWPIEPKRNEEEGNPLLIIWYGYVPPASSVYRGNYRDFNEKRNRVGNFPIAKDIKGWWGWWVELRLMGCDCCAKLVGIFTSFFIAMRCCGGRLRFAKWWWLLIGWFVRFVGMKESLTEYLDETDLNLHNSTLPLSLSSSMNIDSGLDWTWFDPWTDIDSGTRQHLPQPITQ